MHMRLNPQLETVLRRYLVLVPERQDVPLDTELPALGLDSMSALTLLLELEEMFDISFPDSLLNATTFQSAKRLEDVIQMLRKERGVTAPAQDTEEFMGGPIAVRPVETSSSRPIGGTARG
jgi:acyl carrier protein